MLLNTSSTPLRIDDLVLPLAPAGEHLGWTLTTAGETSWTVQPADGTGPLLTGELNQGTLAAATADGFRTGPLMLQADRRLVLQWRIGTASHVAGLASARQPLLSPWTELPVGVPYEIEDPDTAVLVADPVVSRQEGPVQLVLSEQPGRFPIELRSARGTSRIDLAWVPSTEDLISSLADDWLTGNRSTAGIQVLPSGGAALGLQQAFVARQTGSADDAEDALSLRTARLLEQDRVSVMDQAFLAQEAVRTGDPDPLRRSREGLLELTEVQPGLGLAAVRVCLAELALGGNPTKIIAHLREVLTSGPHHPAAATSDDHLLTQAALLELITVTGPVGGGGLRAALLPRLLAVGAELGSGQPGHRLGPSRPVAAIYAAATLDLIGDDLGPELEQRWGTTPHILAERTRTSALAEVLWPASGDREDDQLAEAVGWLVLGRPIE
jgi:hypothetical protein